MRVRRRTTCRSSVTPSTTNSSPLVTPNIGYSRSGAIDSVSQMNAPNASTLMVCVAATVPPRRNAMRRSRCWPIRYAAITDLPWPGASAWIAPNTIATTSESATSGTVTSSDAIRDVNESVAAVTCEPNALDAGEGAAAPPGDAVIVAADTSIRRPSGYTDNRCEIDVDGTSVEVSVTPSPTAVTSRQPT